MKVTGSAVLHAAPEAVYAAITDPAVLSSSIPGCESLTALGDDRYSMTVTAGVASIKGTYDGEVSLFDMQPPAALSMRAKGAGAPGTVETTVQVTLADQGDGTTRLDYAADAVVGGMVGGVGQRMLTSVSKKMAGQFFGNVDDVLTGKRPAERSTAPVAGASSADGAAVPAGAGATPSTGQVFRAPSAASAGVPSVVGNPLAAAGFGAAIALLGVVVGWLVSRRRG